MVDHVVGATTTFAIWKKIHDYFLSNRAARFMILNRQYRNLKQGDLSVQEYARRMKLLTDGLADIEHAVTEVDLTTQFLHRLDTIRVVLGDQGLPFDVVPSRVTLAEESMAQRFAEESASVFALQNGGSSSGSSSSTGGPCWDRSGERTPGPSPHPPARGRGDRHGDGGDRGRGRGRGRGGRGRGDSGGRGQSAAPPMAPFIGYFAPYGMALPTPRTGWVHPNAAGILGLRPGSHAQAYPIQYTAPPTPAPHYPPALYYPPPSPSWDHFAMLNAAYSHGGHHAAAPSNEWFLDSGASSHITGNQGSTNAEGAPDLH
nr:uncharacterized protein LOC109746483 [Aegilops tauschii subsp. strangulata]